MVLLILASFTLIGFVFKYYNILFQNLSVYSLLFETVTPLSLLPSKAEALLEKSKSSGHVQTPDSMIFFGANKNGVKIFAEIKVKPFSSASTDFILTLSDGTTLRSCSPSKPLHCQNWSTNFLTFEVIEPMKAWRIVFNGNLKNNQSSGTNSQHVKVNLLWHASSLPVLRKGNRYDSEYKLFSSSEPILRDEFSGYEQWGTLIGVVQSKTLDGSYTEEEVRLQSFRQRQWGEKDDLNSKELVLISELGNKFSFILTSESRGRSEIGGHLQRTIREQAFIKRSALMYFESGSYSKMSFSDYRSKYDFLVKVCEPQDCSLQFVEWDSDSGKGVGFQRLHRSKEVEFLPDLSAALRVYFSECALNTRDVTVISLDSVECSQIDLVGGKAASLAFMKMAKKHNFLSSVLIPDGICLTTVAMKQHMEASQTLISAIERLNDLGPDINDYDLKQKCEIIASLWTSTTFSVDVLKIIEQFLQPRRLYAVRSSGIQEDGVNISAAGQNETVLNVSGLLDISHATLLCWASLFSFKSVKYRRQHGLPAVTMMGVIIQEMAPADAAGVMFSRHPVTGDPSLISINASSGLGDAVVSGIINPDTITVIRGDDSKFSILEQKSGGENLDPILCLSSKQILDLAKMCIEVENVYGFSCDIEWAVSKDNIYLLQARRITSLLIWSDFEIIHEFDSPCTEDDVSTSHNAGEVFPSAVTALTLSTITSGLCISHNEGLSIGLDNKVLSRYKQNLNVSHHRIFIDCMLTIFNETREDTFTAHLIPQLVLCGKMIAKEEEFALAKRRFSSTYYLPRLIHNIRFSKFVLTSLWSAFLLSIRRTLPRNTNQNTEAYNTEEAFGWLSEAIKHNQKVMLQHVQVSTLTFIVEIIIVAILTENRTDFTEETFSDIACLLTNFNTDVISLKMPLLLEKICFAIKTSGATDEFCATASTMGHQFLQKRCSDAYIHLIELMQVFGHRGISEFEVMADNWLTKPESLIKFLQQLVKNGSPQKSRVNLDVNLSSIIQNLKTPRKNFTRKLLRVFTPVARKFVQFRELSKNEVVRGIHRLRIIFIAIGKAMVKEGRIPDSSLVYYLSLFQLTTLMRTSDSVLLQKALRRRKLWSTINSFSFPEVTSGWPLPTVQKIKVEPGTLQVKGMPVFPGQTHGRACVVKSLDDCNQIQDGDILITKCIDIGWSPYFPLLRGIVVEMGGLLSHGIVVAREYGLPSLVDAMNSTAVFNTGDPVFLDATSGILSKVSTS